VKIAFALVFALLVLPVHAGPLDDPAIEARISSLLAQMTLEEKLGQLNQYAVGMPTGPGTGRGEYAQMVAAGQVGSLFNAANAKQSNELQRIAMTQSRLKIPVLYGFDVIHGYRTVFPVPLGLAATWNPALVEKTAAVAAREASSEGIRWTFSPMVDIARDARWGRIIEGAGEDPYLGSVFAAAYVRGYQGKRLSDPASIAACAKHYVGYGAAEGGRDYNTTEISERLLRDVYLPPFQAAVDAGSVTLMSAFNAINGVPATANAFTLDQVLRREWGFRGFMVSDWTSIKEIIAHGVARDGAAAARKAVLAGVDMDMEGGLYLNQLGAEVTGGRVPTRVIDEAVRRILRVKLALGLFEKPYTKERAPAPLDVELARTAAEQSFVLLKNESLGAAPAPLPIASGASTIALIGPLADSAGDMLGSWSGRGIAEDAVTLRAALTAYAAKRKMTLLYEKGSEIVGGTDAGFAAAVEAAHRADIVLLALGERAGDMTGEAASRTSLGLPGLQEELIAAVAASGRPTVLIVFSRPLALTPVADKVGAIVQAWHPGVQAGPALVRVLSGETIFSGRLPASMPRSVGQEPLYYNRLNTGRPSGTVDLTRMPTNAEEKYVSRYIDETNAPLFPFGHGLSYTRFEYSTLTLSANSLSASALNAGSGAVKASVAVSNVGDRDGVEVVQLYIGQRGTSVARPVRELKGFQRIALRAGESRRIEFELGASSLAFWNVDMKKVVEPAVVNVWVGPDAQSGSRAELTITE
jgi:beta-glucosidase